MSLYDAFISYSHAKDKPIAAALQTAVQKLGKPWYRRRALRVFRDDTSLSATPHLWPTIEQALAESRYLILLASPEAASSQWVNKEAAYWLKHKNPDTLLIAVTDGLLNWDNAANDFVWNERTPLPLAAKNQFAGEPKWVDLTKYRTGADKRDSRFTELAADFAAAIRGIPKEDLLSQEVRQQRRALTLAWSAAGSLAVLIALAGWQWRQAVVSKQAAQLNLIYATRAAGNVVFRIVQDLRDEQGMRLESVLRILGDAQSVLDDIAKVNPDDSEVQLTRVSLLFESTIMYLRAGNVFSATYAADESLAVMRKLAAVEPESNPVQSFLGKSLATVGRTREAAGDRPGALTAYRESAAVMRKLSTTNPKDTDTQRDLASILYSIGRLYLVDTSDGREALAAFEESVAISRKLVAADPGNGRRQQELSTFLKSLGFMWLQTGDFKRSSAAYEESLAIGRKEAATYPDDLAWQYDVSYSLLGIGHVRLAAGDRAGALAAYAETVAIRRKLTAADQGNVNWQFDLAVSLYNVSAASDPVGARPALREALAIVEPLARDKKLTAAQQNYPNLLREALAKLPPEKAGAQ
jgi:tetratricopeptide (TPR) repeat protein